MALLNYERRVMNFKNYLNRITGNNNIYTRTGMMGMTLKELLEREKELGYQYRNIGIPEDEELELSPDVESYSDNTGKRFWRSIIPGQKNIFEGGVEKNVSPYDLVQNNQNLSQEDKVSKIKEISAERNRQINKENVLGHLKNFGGAALQIGSVALPFKISKFIPKTAIKMSKPLIKQLIKRFTTKGALEGGISGAMYGTGRSLMEDKNILKTVLADSVNGALAGGLLGALSGKYITNANKIKNLDTLLDKRNDWGIAYTKQSGNLEDAIDKLLDAKQGFVPNAVSKEGVGDIDLVWGKQDYDTGLGYGFDHIIDRRTSQKIDADKFIRNLPETFKNGQITNSPKFENRKIIEDVNNAIIVAKDWHDKPRNWVVSAYKQNKSARKRLMPSSPLSNITPENGTNSISGLTANNNIIAGKPKKVNSVIENILKRFGIGK